MGALMLFAVGGIALPAVSMAAYTFTLDSDGSQGGPFGTVDVTKSGEDLHFLMNLNSPFYSVTRGKVHHALSFSVENPGATISGLTHGFTSRGFGDFDNPGFKGFNWAIDCNVTSGNPTGKGGCGHTLEFTLEGAGSLLTGDDGIVFAADIYNAITDRTGAVGAVPIPPAALLFGTVMAGFGFAARKKREQQLSFA
jgi:hypothetical protein